MKGDTGSLTAKLAGKVVLQGDTPAGNLIKRPGKAGLCPAHMDTEFRRGSERIALDVING